MEFEQCFTSYSGASSGASVTIVDGEINMQYIDGNTGYSGATGVVSVNPINQSSLTIHVTFSASVVAQYEGFVVSASSIKAPYGYEDYHPLYGSLIYGIFNSGSFDGDVTLDLSDHLGDYLYIILQTGKKESEFEGPTGSWHNSYTGTLNATVTYDTPPTPPVPTDGINIIIQTNSSEPIKLDKELDNITSIYGWLKDDTSIIDPVFLIEMQLQDLIRANYITVPDFGRSYFITDIVSISNNLVELTCHVDVLSSFASEIRTNKGIVFRQEKNWNLYLNDGVIQAYQNPIVVTQEFPKGFTESNYVLVCAGSRNIGGVAIGGGGSIDIGVVDGGGAGNTNSKTTGGLVNYCKAQIGKPYWYGTFGNTADQALLDYKRIQYPTYYPDPGSPDFTTQFGQRVHDCVGLIKGYRWSDTPTSTPVYAASQDVDVRSLFSQCSRLHGNVDFSYTQTTHLIGMCVFDASLTHVGVYVGNGKIVEAQGHAYGVVENLAYDRRGKFTLWGVPDWLQITTSEG